MHGTPNTTAFMPLLPLPLAFLNSIFTTKEVVNFANDRFTVFPAHVDVVVIDFIVTVVFKL